MSNREYDIWYGAMMQRTHDHVVISTQSLVEQMRREDQFDRYHVDHDYETSGPDKYVVRDRSKLDLVKGYWKGAELGRFKTKPKAEEMCARYQIALAFWLLVRVPGGWCQQTCTCCWRAWGRIRGKAPEASATEPGRSP